MTTEQLLTELRGSRTDLPRVVGAALRKKFPYLIVPDCLPDNISVPRRVGPVEFRDR
jgi:hypothetical protein